MRSLFIALLLVPALALATKGPFEPHYKDILSKGIMSLPSKGLMVGNANGKGVQESLGVNGSMQMRTARFDYNFANDGGAIGTTGLGVKLPANSQIVNGWYYIVTQLASPANATVAFQCEDSANIFAATDITASASGTSAAFIPDFATPGDYVSGIAAECEISMVTASSTLTAGKIIGFLNYVVIE